MDTRKNYLIKVAVTFILSLVITALLVLPSKAGSLTNIPSETEDPYRVETFDLSGGGSLIVETSGGMVSLSFE